MDECCQKIPLTSVIVSDMKKYITSERANLFEPNVYISTAITLRGAVSAEALAQAVRAAYSANEAAMSRIVLEDSGAAYYEIMDRSACTVTVDRRGLIEIIRDSEKRPFDLKDGELIRTFIIPDSSRSDTFTLLIHSHHLAGDGKSIVNLIKDILSCLSGKPPVFKPMLSADKELLDSRAGRDSRVKLISRLIERNWKKHQKVFGWDDYYAIHKTYWEKHATDIRVKTYALSECEALRSNGATINSVIICKLLEQYPGIRLVGIPVSIRDNTTPHGMGNLTSGIELRCRYDVSAGFERNLSRIHKAIYRTLNNDMDKYFVLRLMAELDPTLIDAVLLCVHGCYNSKDAFHAAKLLGYTGNRMRQLGVSNLGKIDLDGFCPNVEVCSFLFIPPKVSYSRDIIGVSTFGDKISLCYHDIEEKRAVKKQPQKKK